MVFNLFQPRAKKTSKSVLTSPLLEYRIVFKRGAVKDIMRAKGWESMAEAAECLGITRSYLCMLSLNRVGCTSTVISRVAAALGNTGAKSKWWTFYELVPRGVNDPNHPMWNKEKELGQVPYRKCSPSAAARSTDYKVETKEKWDPTGQKKNGRRSILKKGVDSIAVA